MPRVRANGEGTIYQRKDGRFEGAARLQMPSGKRKRISVYGKTREEAYRKLIHLMEEVHRGILPAEQSYRLDRYLDFWLEREKRRPLTRKRHEAVARLHLKPGLGHHRVAALTVRTVQDFLDSLLAAGKSVATVHQVRKVLSSALTYAMRQELIYRNVARLVELPRYKPRAAPYWNSDEIVRFLNVARDDSLYPAFVLLTLYGLRRGEVLGLRWCDVDFDRNVLHIRQQVQRIEGRLQQVELKTDSSERDEPLLSTVKEVLLRQLDIQQDSRIKAGENWEGSSYSDELVFTTHTGRPLDPQNLVRSFMRICSQHNLRRITLHGLRHSNATAQKDLQVHSRDIQAILGHSNIRTTAIYEHVDLVDKQTALLKIEGRFFGS